MCTNHTPLQRIIANVVCVCIYSVAVMVVMPPRENSVTPEVEKEAHITQTQWMEIRQIVRCIYRENMVISSESVIIYNVS